MKPALRVGKRVTGGIIQISAAAHQTQDLTDREKARSHYWIQKPRSMFFLKNNDVGYGRRNPRAISSIYEAGQSVEFAWDSIQPPLLLIMALAVLLVRLAVINFSVLSDDESVYLMVGTALRHGAIPYVDIIDRKPLGIYLIFALADAVFRDPIIGARLLGALSTLGSAALLKRFGERALGLSPRSGAVCGSLYAIYSLLFFGDAAQTPVFFMPLVIGAAILVTEDLKMLASGVAPRAWRLGIAGLLLGTSLQVKYSTILECLLWGALPLYFGWQQRRLLGRDGLRSVLIGAGLMLAGGLLPTAMAYAVYVVIGHGDAFIFYNFTANLQREASQYSFGVICLRGCLFIIGMSPLAVMSYRFVQSRSERQRERDLPHANRRWLHGVMIAWAATAIAAGLMQRQPFSHYFFDALAPLSLLAAAALHWAPNRRSAARTTAILFALAIIGYTGLRVEKVLESGSPYLPERIADDIRSRDIHCIYVFNAAGIIYHFANAPLPTRYPHPPMLTSSLEADSFAIDAPHEITNILKRNPGAVVLQQPISPQISTDRQQLVLTKLAHDYDLWRTYDAGVGHRIELYVLRTELADGAKVLGAGPRM